MYLTVLKIFREIYRQLHPDIPLLCVCGNHDVGEKPTGGALQQYGSSFGDDYYSFWVSGVRFTVANAQYWKDASDVLNERDVFENWINETFRDEEVLARGEARPRTLMFQHVPFFIDDVNEESTDKSEYFHIRKDRTCFRWEIFTFLYNFVIHLLYIEKKLIMLSKSSGRSD